MVSAEEFIRRAVSGGSEGVTEDQVIQVMDHPNMGVEKFIRQSDGMTLYNTDEISRVLTTIRMRKTKEPAYLIWKISKMIDDAKSNPVKEALRAARTHVISYLTANQIDYHTPAQVD